MNRSEMLNTATAQTELWDMVIIGGGATGVGCAVDAASRGYRVLLLEQSDFGKGTSSRSTKLVHGGVRYLAQGNISLVMEALKERGILRQNAPHLVHDLAFIVPNYAWWEKPYYGLGLQLYNLLSGKYSFGPSQVLSRQETLKRLPTVREEGLRGGVLYYDGQFDDTRLLINLATTAVEQGAVLLNYAPVIGLTKNSAGQINGVTFKDLEEEQEFFAPARVVINATGAFVDIVRRLTDAAVPPMIAPSQGIHIVFDKSFLPGDSAIMIPRTSDGRVLFVIPWHEHTLVGTTDTSISAATLEPQPTADEIDFILNTSAQYLNKAPTHRDILSIFTGIRPLVKASGGQNTAALSRDHTLHLDSSGLLTITGGKWTTYRHMAEDCINRAISLANVPERPCITATLKIHGYRPQAETFDGLAVYGSDAPAIREIMHTNSSLGEKLHPALPYCGAEVIWAARCEMARTLEDVLARRTRALLLNARAAAAIAPQVARLMAGELDWSETQQAEQVDAFTSLTQGYMGSSETGPLPHSDVVKAEQNMWDILDRSHSGKGNGSGAKR